MYCFAAFVFARDLGESSRSTRICAGYAPDCGPTQSCDMVVFALFPKRNNTRRRASRKKSGRRNCQRIGRGLCTRHARVCAGHVRGMRQRVCAKAGTMVARLKHMKNKLQNKLQKRRESKSGLNKLHAKRYTITKLSGEARGTAMLCAYALSPSTSPMPGPQGCEQLQSPIGPSQFRARIICWP